MTERWCRTGFTRPGRSAEAEVQVSGVVQESYAELHKILSEDPHISSETLSALKHLGEGRPDDISTTMAMINDVAVEGTKRAIATGDTRISSLLNDIQFGFSGLDDGRPPLRITTDAPSR